MLFYLVLFSFALGVSAAPARHLHSGQLSTRTTSTSHRRSAVNGATTTLCIGVNSDGHPLQEDTCGVCGGDGSTCRKQTYTMAPSTARTGHAEYYSISIPKGVRRLRILKEQPSTIAHIGSQIYYKQALQTKAGKVFLHKPDSDTDIDYRGTLLEYSHRPDGSEVVNVPGKVQALFLVTVKLTRRVWDASSLPKVTVTYIREVRDPSENSYFWTVGDWTVCTRTCGGGVRMRPVVCHRHRRRGEPIVSKDSFCVEAEGDKPTHMSLCSPFRCPTTDNPVYVWQTGNWSQCSEQCGYQTRQVTCHKMIPGSVSVVPDDLCSFSNKLPDRNQCSGPQCPVLECRDRTPMCPHVLKIHVLNCNTPGHRLLCCESCRDSTPPTGKNRRGPS